MTLRGTTLKFRGSGHPWFDKALGPPGNLEALPLFHFSKKFKIMAQKLFYHFCPSKILDSMTSPSYGHFNLQILVARKAVGRSWASKEVQVS